MEDISQIVNKFLEVDLFEDDFEETMMPHYGIYNKKGHSIEYYCTRCKDWIYDEIFSQVKHNEDYYCSRCRGKIRMLAEGRKRGGKRETRNFVKFKKISDIEVVAIAYKVTQMFSSPGGIQFNPIEDGLFDYSAALICAWHFTPKCARRFTRRFDYPASQFIWKEGAPDREPSFTSGYLAYLGNDYKLIDDQIMSETFMKYIYKAVSSIALPFMKTIADFTLHPNLEYVVNGGFRKIIADRECGNGKGAFRLNLRSDNLKKMLGLNSEEIKTLNYMTVSSLSMYKHFRDELHLPMKTAQRMCETTRADKVLTIHHLTELPYESILDYSEGSASRVSDWCDYLEQCRDLGYNLRDTSIVKPHDLNSAHERTSILTDVKKNKRFDKMIADNCESVAQLLSFETEDFIVRVPRSAEDIIAEGKILHHCVGSYLERHAKGKLYIVFLRRRSDPDTPFYTIEVSTDGRIVQCRGFRNNNAKNPKTQDIIDFESEYQERLKAVFLSKEEEIA